MLSKTCRPSSDEFWLDMYNIHEGKQYARAKARFEIDCEWWFVVHARVPVRDSPSTSTGKPIDVLRKGTLLHGAVEYVGGARWLRLHTNELQHFKAGAGIPIPRP